MIGVIRWFLPVVGCICEVVRVDYEFVCFSEPAFSDYSLEFADRCPSLSFYPSFLYVLAVTDFFRLPDLDADIPVRIVALI